MRDFAKHRKEFDSSIFNNLLSAKSISRLQSNYHFSSQTMQLRSLYTMHRCHSREKNNIQVLNDYSKNQESPLTEEWQRINFMGTLPIKMFSNNNPKQVITSSLLRSDKDPTHQTIWKETNLNDAPQDFSDGAVATPHGTISLRLHNRIRVEMSLDRAIRITNCKNSILLSLSSSGSAAALLHPNGRIYQYGSRVEILAHDTYGNNKYAKMWYKGVSFTSEQCALVYLVDAAGTRTTTDSFSDMNQDFSLNVFSADSRQQNFNYHEALAVLEGAQYWQSDEGVENWIINNVRISQTPDGLVKVARSNSKYQLRTSASNGTATVTTPFLHCTASLGQSSHLFVRRGERRMHYDGRSFIVRNAGHSAGFDNNNQLKVY